MIVFTQPNRDSLTLPPTAKMRRRGNISMQLIAKMLVKGGFDHIVTVDLFSKESLGFFDCNVDNVRASPFLIQYIVESVRMPFALADNGSRYSAYRIL